MLARRWKRHQLVRHGPYTGSDMGIGPAGEAPFAMTVRGPVDPAGLGTTLIHEHLRMDSTPLLAVHGYSTTVAGPYDAAAAAEARWNPGGHPDNYRLIDVDLIARELLPAAELGVRTVVDVTPVELGRDPIALRRIADLTGLHVVMGGGHYLGAVHGPETVSASEATLAKRMVREWRDGVDGSGIRPGLIGELGTSDPMQPAERRVLRAAARASATTGLALLVHLHPWGRTGPEAADVLLGSGADPKRVVLGHLDTAHDDRPYLEALIERGTYLAFDLFGFDHSLIGVGRWPPAEASVAATVARLVHEGLRDRLLLSGDLGVRSRLHAYGGWGYDHLVRHVVPLLRGLGLSGSDLTQILVANPRAVLTIAGPVPREPAR